MSFNPTQHAPALVKAEAEIARYRSPATELCFDVSRWTRSTFDDEVREGGVLAGALQMRTSKQDRGTFDAFVREIFARLYEVGCTQKSEPEPFARDWAPRLHAEAEALPEWAKLEGLARHDPWRVGIATGAIAKTLASSIPEMPEDTTAAEAESEMLNAMLANGKKVNRKRVQRRLEKLQRDIAESHRKRDLLNAWTVDRQGQFARHALRVGVLEATKELEALVSTVRALGLPGDTVAPSQRSAVVKAMRNPRVRELANLAGRFRQAARVKQRAKGGHGVEEVHAVTQGSDLARLLPTETMLLGMGPTGAALLHARMTEQRAAQYAVRAKSREERGPLVFCLDESGSMKGTRDALGKAFALGMMEVAREQKRPFAMVHFDSRVSRVDVFEDPSSASVDQVVEALCHFSGGGTRIATALSRAMDEITRRPKLLKSDVVIVTDDEDSSVTEAQMAECAAKGIAVYLVRVEDEGSGKTALARLAEKVVDISEEDDEAQLGELLSI